MVSKVDEEKQQELDLEEEQSVGTDGGDHNTLPTVFEGIEGKNGEKGKGKVRGETRIHLRILSRRDSLPLALRIGVQQIRGG
ncbi:hypothetical protein V6N11_007584 [Hibiscus sabdariffa]|uniref:Uncharacterized protein n=1 Tax=Hibiscus sabdariffa TaxID=183260 RepID=A0ABR1ZVT3_9ROSI